MQMVFVCQSLFNENGNLTVAPGDATKKNQTADVVGLNLTFPHSFSRFHYYFPINCICVIHSVRFRGGDNYSQMETMDPPHRSEGAEKRMCAPTIRQEPKRNCIHLPFCVRVLARLSPKPRQIIKHGENESNEKNKEMGDRGNITDVWIKRND